MRSRLSYLISHFSHHSPHKLNFVHVDCVRHIPIEAGGHYAAQVAQYSLRFQDAAFGDVRVHIAAPQEDGSAIEGAIVIAGRVLWTDQSPAQAHYTAVTT